MKMATHMVVSIHTYNYTHLVLCDNSTPPEFRYFTFFSEEAAKKFHDDIKPFAEKIGLTQQMLQSLFWLGGPSQVRAAGLLWDHAPHSLCFSNGLYGGWIYQGPDSPANGGAPSFTVSLTPGVGWFAHT